MRVLGEDRGGGDSLELPSRASDRFFAPRTAGRIEDEDDDEDENEQGLSSVFHHF